MLTTGRVIEAVDLPGQPDEHKQDKKTTGSDAPLTDWLKEQEKQYLAQKLARFSGQHSAHGEKLWNRHSDTFTQDA